MTSAASTRMTDPDSEQIDRALAQSLLDGLRELSFDGVGITRLAYSPLESAALDLVEAKAKALGLATRRDAGSNLVVTLAGSNRALPALACGSHIDSVPRGGNFDGAAGVVAGLVALARLRDDGLRPVRDIQLIVLRGEESARFGRAYMGSKALFGELTETDLASKAGDTGQTLAECMEAVGVDVQAVRQGQALLNPETLCGWLELHIEQGPELTARGLPIGIVTAIRGNSRHRNIVCVGESGHSGAVPRWLRHDALLAAAELLTRMDRYWAGQVEAGHDLVITSGIFSTDPAEHALARIPGVVQFSLDIRSQNMNTINDCYRVFREECATIQEQRGVQFTLDGRLDSAPAEMDAGMVALLSEAACGLGVVSHSMASGGGHDAAVFANAGVPSGMIFVRNQNGSHNPAEAMDIDDLMVGTAVLREALRSAGQVDERPRPVGEQRT
ncbi:MAG: Zn-dependent hydrolase [Devosia sp.]|nr:Zn-dependent hydrolase [Devosia sp.]